MPRPDWPTASAHVPAGRSTLRELAQAANGCRGCPLWEPATQTVYGPTFRVTQSRGVLMPFPPSGDSARFGAGQALATLHPSAVLRADDVDAARAGVVADLRIAAQALDNRAA